MDGTGSLQSPNWATTQSLDHRAENKFTADVAAVGHNAAATAGAGVWKPVPALPVVVHLQDLSNSAGARENSANNLIRGPIETT